jgi:nucleotidyltransferase/DNA polymerase involved in DNA repair
MNSPVQHKEKVLKQLQVIPGIGKACALDLWNIGIRKVADLKNKNPQVLYYRLNKYSGTVHDVCMLYTFRCAVYFSTEKIHDNEKLNWWYWKDKSYNEQHLSKSKQHARHLSSYNK